jgi:hypothetical protein
MGLPARVSAICSIWLLLQIRIAVALRAHSTTRVGLAHGILDLRTSEALGLKKLDALSQRGGLRLQLHYA